MKRFILTAVLISVFSGCAVNSGMFVSTAQEAVKAPTHKEAVEYFNANTKTPARAVNSNYYELLGDIHYRYGYFGEAVNEYTNALKIYSKAEFHLKRGRSYMKLHFYEDAVRDFSSVIGMKGIRMPVAYLERAKAYVAQGDYKSAVKDLNKVKKREGESTQFLVAMGELLFQMNRPEEAKAYVQRAIEKDTENADLYYLRARLYYDTKDANQALNDLNKTLLLDENHLDAKRMLAWVYSTNPLEIYRNGEKALRIAKELYGINSETIYVEVLAAAYAETGDYEKAIEVLKEGIRQTADLVKKEDFRFDIELYKKKENLRVW